MMDNEPHNCTEAALIDRLKSLPLQDAPPDLTGRVLARITASRQPFLQSIWNYIGQTQTISLRPLYAFSILLLICGAFFLGRFSQPPAQQTGAIPQTAAELLPSMIETPRSAYLVGRGLLQTDDSREQALAFLKRASMLDPGNPEFAYWEGVGHWANGNDELERQSYLRGLDANPTHIPLLINLGHSYLGENKYHEALDAYRNVLASRPDEPAALYNSGLIFRSLGMKREEISSWQQFLQHHRQGTKAIRALKRLNGYGDHTFRSYRIGAQPIIVNQQRLLDDSASTDLQIAELIEIAAALDQDQSLSLEIVVFIENDREAARERAMNTKKLISALTDTDVQYRLGLSWFDEPEIVRSADSHEWVILSEGLLMFTHRAMQTDKETSI